MKNPVRVLVIWVLAAALISACAGPVNSLYGSWRSSEQPALTLEFHQDGSLLMTSQGMTQIAVFEMTGDKKDALLLKATKDTPAEQGNPLTFTVSGDTLTLMVSGQPQIFTRLK